MGLQAVAVVLVVLFVFRERHVFEGFGSILGRLNWLWVAAALGGEPDPAVPGSLIRAEHGETVAILDNQAASRLRN